MPLQKKKSLGQHFLHSAHYLALVADAAHLEAGECVLEIGPGEGTLTHELLARGAWVTAVEKDHRLIELLQEKFTQEISEGRFRLFEGDALHFDISKYGESQRYKVVGNIPYYITGALLKKFLSAEHQPGTIVFLMQKEVAERIARSTKESILSLSIKAYGRPRYVKTIPRGAFSPPPRVDSGVLAIESISRGNFADAAQEKRFFELVRAGFAQKRKLLKRNLEPVLGKSASAAMQRVSIPEHARAEDVSLEKWFALAAF
ncbi:MAG: ribosomal RNA small subunit methyltransferase A [Patescibacteria group bacterium]|nr:ribosomal RNA small subunit methyltransferase A [Patescibacteria group bacterium]